MRTVPRSQWRRLRKVLTLAEIFGSWGCHYCGRELDFWTVTIEHIVPRSYGGPDQLRNSALACEPCNQAMGAALIKCTCPLCAAARRHVADQYGVGRAAGWASPA
jgi:hypothetical protein